MGRIQPQFASVLIKLSLFLYYAVLVRKQKERPHASSVLFVATKADKVSRGGRQKQLTLIKKTLGLLEVPLYFSAETGEGIDELAAAIAEIITPSSES